MKVRAVTFDAGGTLIAPWPSVGHIYAEVALAHGVRTDPTELNRRFKTQWAARRAFAYTRADWAALVDAVFSGLTPEPPSRTFFASLYDRFGKAECWKEFDEVRPALETLRARGMRLAVLSNWDERLCPLLYRMGLAPYFEVIFVSAEMGFHKPDRHLFDAAARTLGLPPQSILHVGDCLGEDVEGAIAAGWNALWLRRNASASLLSTASQEPHSIHSLAQIVGRI